MFLDFYNLREQPFGVTPDPRFLYFGSTHREALASLLYSIETKRGFSALAAEPGMGKTSLLFRMLDAVQSTARTAFLFQTEGDSQELLRSMLHDLGIKVTSEDPVSLREALNESLLGELKAGKQIVVVIDEAQNLDAKVLETVRLLSNFETSKQKLMHIVLAGQPGLAAKLSEPSMMQLRQRVSTILRLEPFQAEEVVKYVNHRLRVAGCEAQSIFSPDALEMIARASHGIPRNINSLCFQSLSLGFAMQSKRIGAEIVREVMSDLDFKTRSTGGPRRQEPAAWPPPEFDRGSLPGNSRLGVWEQVSPFSPRPSRMKWAAVIACLAVVPAAILAMSDSRFGLTDTIPGQFSQKVVNAVLSSTDPNADFVPRWPDKLRPPKPPPAAATQITSSSSTVSSDDQNPAPSSNSKETDGASSKLAPGESSQPSSVPRNEATRDVAKSVGTAGRSRGEIRRVPTGVYDGPTSVVVERSETLFQLAVEVYGHSNWTIVEALCAANPGVHDPFSILKVGQRVRLPSDLVTAKADYNSRSAIGRLR